MQLGPHAVSRALNGVVTLDYHLPDALASVQCQLLGLNVTKVGALSSQMQYTGSQDQA